jgi:hypothetical protein
MTNDHQRTRGHEGPAMSSTAGRRVRRKLMMALAVVALAVPAAAGAADAAPKQRPSHGHLLASGLQGTIGSTIGPDGALYVAEGGLAGRITRVDPRNGKTTTFASGLPTGFDGPPFGGVLDVAFIGTTAYALVTLVDPAEVGIYRLDHANCEPAGACPLIAPLGQWSLDNPPPPTFFVDTPAGLQFALEPIPGGFIVSDGHLNRVLQVTLPVDDPDNDIRALIQCGNVVPTGLEISGNTVYVSEVGPVPYAPADGRVVSFNLTAATVPPSCIVSAVASGFSTIVDVELGPDGVLYALSQGDSPGNVPAATPALPNSGELLRVNNDGTFSVVIDRLNRPSSLEFIGNTAFILTLNGEVWRINSIAQHAKHL